MTQSQSSFRSTRRQFLQWTAATGGVALLAACAPAAAPGAGEGAAVDAAPIELSFDMYNFDPWLVALDEMFTVYSEQNEGVTATVQSAPWEEFWSRQEARLAAGNPSDLSIGDPSFFGRYAHKGYYMDLASYVERDQVDLEQWFETTINDCRYNSDTGVVGQGELFGMPATYVGIVTYYNKDLFDAAGLPYPDETWDRNSLFDAALALTLDSSGNNAGSADFDSEDIVQWGASIINGYSIALNVWNNGGELINADQTECLMTEPESVEIFEWLASLLHEHGVNPTPAQLEGLPNPFQIGRVAFTIDGTWNLDYYANNTEFNWDIAPVPLGTAGLDRVTYAGTNTVHLFKDSAHVDEAWNLLQFMVGSGGMEYFAETGTPSLIETANSEEYLSGPPDNRELAVELGAYARNYYPGLKSDQWKQIYTAELEGLWINQSSASEVLTRICERITPILETPVDEI